MTRVFANKLYLIIVVVTSLTLGFITGYIVGSIHSVNPATSGKASIGSQEGEKFTQDSRASETTRESKETVAAQNIKTKGMEEPTTTITEPAKPIEEKTAEKPTDDSAKVKEEKTRKGLYTVQTGAFKNEKEAEVLKTNLEKKGYNVYIIKESKKGPGLFKVRVGEFETKREAEVFAIKLSKTEGLKAFAVKR